ncbi:hypothetical protein ABPG74_008322 [Tetrahymena malaccensis]
MEAFTKEKFIYEYNNLCTHPDQVVKQKANLFIMNFQKSNEAWSVCKELLDTKDQQIQFIAAQIILMKTKQNFLSLSNDAYFELRAFLFNQVENREDFSVPTLQRLCSALSALALVGLGFGNWQTLVEDLIPFMQKGKKQLWIGLQVMQSLVENKDDMILGNNVVSHIKKILIQQSSSVIDIFNSLLTLDDVDIVKKSLECLESWAGFEMKMLYNSTLVTNVIKNGQRYTQLVCEILIKMIKNSENTDLLARNQLDETSASIPEQEYLNIQNVIRLINELPQSIYTCDLLVNLLQNFPIILLSSTEMCQGLFNMYFSFLNSNEPKISSNAISYIEEWLNNLKQYSLENIQPHYVEFFSQSLKILIEKCKKRKIDKITKAEKPVIIIDTETGEETHYNPNADESDDDLNLEEKKMTLHEYRECCQDAFYNIFKALRDLQQERGIQQIYDYIFSLLDPQSYMSIPNEQTRFEQYCLTAEVAIYASINFIELESQYKNNTNIDKIITFIISQLPISDITVQTGLQYLYDASYQFKHNPNLFHPTIQFILTQFNNPKLSSQAAESLKSIIELSESHSHFESLQLLGEFFTKAFSNQNLISFPTLESLIQAVLVFTVKLNNEEQKKNAIFSFLQIFQIYLEQEYAKVVAQTLSRQDLERLLDIMKSIFQGFDLLELKYRKNSQKLVSQFVAQNLHIIDSMFKQFSTIRFKAFYERFITLYVFIIKSCGKDIPEQFVNFLNISLEIFQQNPLKYYASLKLLNKLIEELSSQSQVLQNWLLTNYGSLNTLIYNILISDVKNQDPDLMKYYFELCKNMQLHFEQILLQSNFEQTLQFIFHTLTHVENFNMTREILKFLSQLVQKNHTIDYTQILANIVKAINLLQRVQINHLAVILIQSILKNNNDQVSALVIYQNLDLPEQTEDEKKYIAEELLKVAKTNNLANVKKVATALYALSCRQSDMEGFKFELQLMYR